MARIDTRTFRSKDGVPFEVRSPEVAEAQALLEFAVTTAASTDQILTRPEEFPDLEGEKAYIQAALEDDAAFQIAAIHAGRFIGTLGFHGGRNFRNRHTAELGMMVASRALYRKMGFEEEGRLRGHIQLENGRVEDLLHMAVWVKPRR
jgi:RimJ/RimL family protein N-acetyltransferase